ncbi:MAG TPA: ABC transporter substrate-binding protein [Sporichthyaceae bacterium]|nr:ABC transporter substrate-binding protein [Sporichthyaceae bacterium]
MTTRMSAAVRAVPVLTAVGLVLAACGSGGPDRVSSQAAAPETPAVAPAAAAPAAVAPAAAAPAAVAAPAKQAPAATQAAPAKATAAKASPAKAAGPAKVLPSSADKAVYDKTGGATDVGITKDRIALGSVNMHGMALGNVLTAPQARGNMATAMAINDRGGVLGRRLTISDCDDGPGEVSRAKACIKKLVGQDHIFSMITGIDWATASIHDDLRQFHLPYVGAWAYSQTEWQDPFMFPTHMSMLNEALAGAHWAANVIHPKTYGLICLTSPEMQLACGNVQRVMDASGAKLVKKADVSISETSMGPYVLAMRAAAPEHIIHYVINPSTIAKFLVESAQQGYFPPKGVSGNHMGSEIVGSLFGKWPAGRYWTNTTYRFWGTELMATMAKYARQNRGEVHHIVQAGYVAINIFAEAAKEVGPNLTRDKLMAVLGNDKVWKADSSLDQTWTWVKTERGAPGTGRPGLGQNREFMYKYEDPNTVSNPDGTPNGWKPDSTQFVIYTDH